MVSVRGNQTNNKVTASSSTSTNNRAEVKPVNINNQVEATNNLAKYYSEISRDWAIGEGLIQNIDYSSKTYALQSKEYANDAKESMEITEEYMDNAISNIQTAETNALSNIVMQEESALSTVNQGIEQLNTTITEGVETIETLQANSLAEITTNKELALSDITTAETNVLANIDTTKLNTLAQIEELANSSIEDINATGIDTKVSKSGDTMTGPLILEKGLKSKSGLDILADNVIKGEAPASSNYWGIRFNDSVGEGAWRDMRLGLVECSVTTDNSTALTFGVYKNEAGSTSLSSIKVGYDNAGNSYATAPTPALTDKSTKIATTSFVRSGGWDMPSTKSTNLTFGASGTQYTAPANGWVTAYIQATASGQYVVLTTSSGFNVNCFAGANGNTPAVTVGVRKGDVATLKYTAAGSTKSIKFIYAQGEV